MILKTRHFGEVNIDDSKIIDFKEGIPGFPNLNRFVMLTDDKDKTSEGVFYWLQSVDDADIAFVLVNMLKIMPDYNPLVEREDMEPLGEYNEEAFNFYNIAVLPDNLSDMTVNLKAPVVINTERKKGKQVVCTNNEYSVRHYMFK